MPWERGLTRRGLRESSVPGRRRGELGKEESERSGETKIFFIERVVNEPQGGENFRNNGAKSVGFLLCLVSRSAWIVFEKPN